MTDIATLEVRFETFVHYHEERHHALKEALDSKEHALKEALDSTNVALEKRLDGMNEFREEARTVQNTYLRRDLYEQNHETLITRVSRLEGTLRGIYIGLGITLLTTVVTLVVLLFKGHG